MHNFFQLINIGSQYNYGNEDHAEFLCVVSREYGTTLNSKETEPTDRAKVILIECIYMLNFILKLIQT